MAPETSIVDAVDNLVHEPTQVHDDGVDLTVGAVYRVGEPGRLDFGGDELEDADLDPIPTTARNPDDRFEWWELAGGQYVVQYNEFLTGEATGVVQPRNELLARGGSHPTLRVSGHLPLLPLGVADGGLHLKENARISTIAPLEPPRDSASTDE